MWKNLQEEKIRRRKILFLDALPLFFFFSLCNALFLFLSLIYEIKCVRKTEKTSTKKRKEKNTRAGCLLMTFPLFLPSERLGVFFLFSLVFFLEKVCEACSGNLKGEENGVVGRVNGGSESQ